MSSLSPNSHMHSGSRGSSGFRRTYILLLISIFFVSSLNMTLDLFSRTLHVNCCIRYRFRPSWFTWEMLIRLKPHAFNIHNDKVFILQFFMTHYIMLCCWINLFDLLMFVLCCLSHEWIKLVHLEVLFILTPPLPSQLRRLFLIVPLFR